MGMKRLPSSVDIALTAADAQASAIPIAHSFPEYSPFNVLMFMGATLKQSAAETGSMMEENLNDAYSALLEWLESIGEPEDSEIVQILEEINQTDSCVND